MLYLQQFPGSDHYCNILSLRHRPDNTRTHIIVTNFCSAQFNQIKHFLMPPSDCETQESKHNSALPTNSSWWTGWKQSKSQGRETSDKCFEFKYTCLREATNSWLLSFLPKTTEWRQRSMPNKSETSFLKAATRGKLQENVQGTEYRS